MLALDIQHLSKTYKNGVQALNDVSLSVESGDFFALLGPNGAGKSTTIGVITSLVHKTKGQVNIFGVDIDKDFQKAKSMIGVVPQEFNFNAFAKVGEIVLNQAGYYGISYHEAKKRTDHYLGLLELSEKKNKQVRTLSGGMKRRLMIARALINQPKMLILDEPTAGVDIEIRRSTWGFLKELNEDGVTIILTTHYLEEAENLCRNIAIINSGKVVENTTMPALLRQLEYERFILYLSSDLHDLPNIPGYDIKRIDARTIDVEISSAQHLTHLVDALKQHDIIVSSMRNKSNRLEELFIRLTQEKGSV